eukprot:c12671_g1_i2.p1 GENE.c12671_g1_i2~~c12671_g1_i2.p1  ORF type:complete len:336 (+),score=66.57 c12671_g1_i2:118-1125(+)
MNIAALQLGVCTVYISFVSTNIHTLASEAHAAYQPSYRLIALMVSPIFLALSLFRRLSHITPFTVVGNMTLATGVIIVLGSLGKHFATSVGHLSQLPLTAPLSKIPVFIGSVLYSFEGVALVLPIESEMAIPKLFPATLLLSMSVVGVVFFVTGTYCYVALAGDVSSGSLSASLGGYVPEATIFVVNILLCIAVLTSYPLQLVPAMTLVESGLVTWLRRRTSRIVCRSSVVFDTSDTQTPLIDESNQLTKTQFICVRVTTYFILLGVAILIPNVGLLITLIGSLCSSLLGLVIPPLLHIKLCSPSRLSTALDLCLIVLGIFSCIIGTVIGIQELI